MEERLRSFQTPDLHFIFDFPSERSNTLHAVVLGISLAEAARRFTRISKTGVEVSVGRQVLV